MIDVLPLYQLDKVVWWQNERLCDESHGWWIVESTRTMSMRDSWLWRALGDSPSSDFGLWELFVLQKS